MAVWQFKFYLVPASGIFRVHGGEVHALQCYRTSLDGPKVVEDGEIENYWGDKGPGESISNGLSSILPQARSWSEDAKMFGEEEGNWIEIWTDDVSCRVDMRQFSESYVRRILALASESGCKIVIHGSGEVVEPQFDALLPHIVSSNALKFCRSPEEYLRNLPRSER